MNILKGLLFLQNSSIIDVRLSYIEASENIEIFKEKLSWSKLSRLLQRTAFSCYDYYHKYVHKLFKSKFLSSPLSFSAVQWSREH